MVIFTIHNYRLFAPVQINDQKTYAFLDTGANRSGIASSHTEGLSFTDEGVVHGAFGQQVQKIATVESVEFLGKRVTNSSVWVEEEPSWQADHIPFSVGCVLGSDILLTQPLILDFCEMEIGYLNKRLPTSAQNLSAFFSHGIPYLKLQWADKPITVMFDIGAGMSVVNTAKSEFLCLSQTEAYSLDVDDAAGEEERIRVYRNSSLSIGGSPVGECDYLGIDLTPIEEKVEQSIDMVLGINTMLRLSRVWVIDRENENISLLPSPLK